MVMDPVVREVQFCVRLLSEYMARFMAVTVPLYGTVCEELSNPQVVKVRTVPTMARATTKAIIFVLPSFWNIIVLASPLTY